MFVSGPSPGTSPTESQHTSHRVRGYPVEQRSRGPDQESAPEPGALVLESGVIDEEIGSS